MRKKVIIMGAAGRDFHNFNTYFRDDESYEVVAFTATQIPDIDGRLYPPELSGRLYPDGIPIRAEADLAALVKEHGVDFVVFSYSDVSYDYVLGRGAEAMAAGAEFLLLGPHRTWIPSKKPVIAICAVRTGCGKSQTTRCVAEALKQAGKRTVAIRHPMPYGGDLTKQIAQRFETYEDLEAHRCTIEEREEYEPHIARGNVVYAGADYGRILELAEQEADVILWDGGNNDLPFYKPDLFIVVVDPLRAGHELRYYPGETNLRMADIALINKIDSAEPAQLELVRANIAKVNPKATVLEAASPVTVADPGAVTGKRVLVVEDGPTLTHGEMAFGAGVVAARQLGAEIVDPRPFAVGSLLDTFAKYPTTGPVLPAMGYGDKQVAELRETIAKADCDAVIIGTPIDLGRLIEIDKPHTRVLYELDVKTEPGLTELVQRFLAQ